ncbi:MAG: glycosyltransferase [Chthoniobacterales bacterium]
MNKRILIMSASVGSGHVRSAKALAEEFRSRPGVEEVIYDDALEHTNVLYRQFYSDLYATLSQAAPKFLGWWYESMDDPWRSDQVRLLLDLPNTLPLVKYIKDFKPDAIVCTHFMPAGVVSHLLEKKRLKTRLYNVVTDYHFHAEWITRAFNHYFVAQEEDRQHMRGLGLPKQRVSVTGIPIDSSFTKPVNRKAICKEHDLNPDKPILLISAGALGLSPAASVLKRVLDMPQDLQVIMLCGQKKEVRKEAERVAKTSKKKVVILGYTSDIHSLMKTADLLLSKPGGLTTAEALACGLPMIILDPVGGQEERNADMLLENGAAIKCTELTVLQYKLGQLLDNPKHLSHMAQKAAQLGHPDSTSRVVDIVLKDEAVPYIITSKQEKVLRKRVERQ